MRIDQATVNQALNLRNVESTPEAIEAEIARIDGIIDQDHGISDRNLFIAEARIAALQIRLGELLAA